MVITLDGSKAVGKSTQAGVLSSLLNIEHVKVWDRAGVFRFISRLFTDCSPASSDLFSILQSYHTIPKSCVVEGLWLPLQFFGHRSHDLNSIIELFRASLRLHKASEPNLSIYLYLSEDERLKRFAKRESKDIGRIEITGSFRENKRLPFWRRVEEQVPYFYLVDGNQPEKVITEYILSLLPKTKQ